MKIYLSGTLMPRDWFTEKFLMTMVACLNRSGENLPLLTIQMDDSEMDGSPRFTAQFERVSNVVPIVPHYKIEHSG